jgi:glycosyltransferase involved in cell wall biosynthesis
MSGVAYLFERFPSFGQTFCYREVAELERQRLNLHVFSIRRPTGEPGQDWDRRIVERVHYLPEEKELVPEVDRLLKKRAAPPQARDAIENWGRRSDFLRLYQAVHVGLRMQEAGLHHVHAHFAGMAARTAWWIREFFGISYSVTAHANDIFAPRDFEVSLEKIISGAAAIVTVSDFAVGLLRGKFPDNADKIRRVYNGIDLSRFSPAKPGDAVPSIIAVGRLIEKKGFADLIDSCAILKDSGQDFTCTIIGEGPLEDALRSRTADRGLEDCVELAGPLSQSEIGARLACSTVFVLPCVREADGAMDNLPTVIMEAMAAGLPVISTPIAGIPEMVEDGATGELVAEREPVALAAAIKRLIDDPQRARQLGERGRERAREKFAIEESARQLRELFWQL